MIGNRTFWVGLLVLALGILVLALAIMRGQATLALIVIIPVIYGSSWLLALGAVLAMVGLFLLFAGYAQSVGAYEDETEGVKPLPAGTGQPAEKKVSYGGFLLIGPVPVVFGNRPAWLPYLIILAVITVVALVIFLLL
jgi:uncharacterized protein (TIGR00304 family)